jgi:hypothetical protein
MSRRIDIELTSARPDGSWTWRAAGAREPRGVVDGALVPGGAKTGQVFKAEAEVELDGLTIVSVAGTKGSTPRSGLLELIPSDKPFEAVTQQLARRERSDRGDRGDRPRRDRPDGDRPRGDRPGGDRPRGDRPGGDRPRSDRPGGDRPGGDRPRGDRPAGDRPRGDRPAGQGDREVVGRSSHLCVREVARGTAREAKRRPWGAAGQGPGSDFAVDPGDQGLSVWRDRHLRRAGEGHLRQPGAGLGVPSVGRLPGHLHHDAPASPQRQLPEQVARRSGDWSGVVEPRVVGVQSA